MVVMSKKVSIIMPCYNQGEYVKEAIESVYKQTYKNIELICVNDASSDDSHEIIKALSGGGQYENFIYINHLENKGVVATRNEAIEIATGEYILPLDADDTIEPTFVEKAVKILDENPDVGIVYCWVRSFGNGMSTYTSKINNFDLNMEIFENSIVNTSMFRKSEFIEVGGYKDYMKNGFEDWELWISILEKGYKAYLIKEVLFNYRRNIASSRSGSVAMQKNELYLAILKNHLDFYLNNPQTIERIFTSAYYKKAEIYKQFEKLKRYCKMLFELTFLLIMFYIIMFLYLIF